MISIRRTNDLRTVQALDEELIGEDVLSAGQLAVSSWWLVRVNGEIAGYCGVKASTPEWAYLIRSGVREQYRGRGLQRRMIQKRVAWAKARGFRCVVTETLLDNPWSSNNLIACGFCLFDPGDIAWAGADVLYWKRDISVSK